MHNLKNIHPYMHEKWKELSVPNQFSAQNSKPKTKFFKTWQKERKKYIHKMCQITDDTTYKTGPYDTIAFL